MKAHPYLKWWHRCGDNLFWACSLWCPISCKLPFMSPSCLARILVQLALLHISASTAQLPRLCGGDILTQPEKTLYLGAVILAEDEFKQHRLHCQRMEWVEFVQSPDLLFSECTSLVKALLLNSHCICGMQLQQKQDFPLKTIICATRNC